MRKFAPLIAASFLGLPIIPSISYAASCLPKIVCTYVDPAHGLDHPHIAQGCVKPACNNPVEVAQYYPAQPQYQPPAFFQGSSGPVVVPPTVINPPGPRECRKRRVSFLLIFERESADC